MRIDRGWDYVHLTCSDGLTKHVSDKRIRERLMTMTSAKQVCEDLIQDALDGGGTDNITMIIGPPVKRNAWAARTDLGRSASWERWTTAVD